MVGVCYGATYLLMSSAVTVTAQNRTILSDVDVAKAALEKENKNRTG
jgi:hypothetical protein